MMKINKLSEFKINSDYLKLSILKIKDKNIKT